MNRLSFILLVILICAACTNETPGERSQPAPPSQEKAAAPAAPSPEETMTRVREPVKKDLPPPDAQLYQIAFQGPFVKVIQFPEYPEWERLSANTYAILDTKSRRFWLVDPGVGSVRMILYWAEKEGASLRAIFLTHGHLDHVGGVQGVLSAFPSAPVYVSPADAAWMSASDPIFEGIRAPLPPSSNDLLKDGQSFTMGEQRLEVIFTPGHTVGSVCFLLKPETVLFSGDTLLPRSIGRGDLPHALTLKDTIRSIKERLLVLPDDTLVMPGHGNPTSIGREIRENRYLK